MIKMLSEKSSTTPEILTQFGDYDCKRGRNPTESPKYIYILRVFDSIISYMYLMPIFDNEGALSREKKRFLTVDN